jgi:hypothetical protein
VIEDVDVGADDAFIGVQRIAVGAGVDDADELIGARRVVTVREVVEPGCTGPLR